MKQKIITILTQTHRGMSCSCCLFSWVLIGKKTCCCNPWHQNWPQKHNAITLFLRKPNFSVTHWWSSEKPHLIVGLIKDALSMLVCFVSEEQWMDVLCKLNIQATGMSKWSKFQPRFRVSNSKWKTGWERRTEEQICSSCMWVYALFTMGVALQHIQYHRHVPEPWIETGVGTVVGLASKINPYRTFLSLQQIRQQN